MKLNKRKKLIAVVAIFLIFALTIAFFTLNYTKEGNALIATNFIKNEATYKFDGIPEIFKLNETKTSAKYSWEFYFEYLGRNSGYGDRINAIPPSPDSHLCEFSDTYIEQFGGSNKL